MKLIARIPRRCSPSKPTGTHPNPSEKKHSNRIRRVSNRFRKSPPTEAEFNLCGRPQWGAANASLLKQRSSAMTLATLRTLDRVRTNFGEHRPKLADCARKLADLGPNRSEPADIGPLLANSGPILAEIEPIAGRLRAKLGRNSPSCTPNVPKSNQSWAIVKFGRSQANVGGIWPKSAQLGPQVGQSYTVPSRSWSCSAEAFPNLVIFGPSSADATL